MTPNEIDLMEWDLSRLNIYIERVVEACSKRFPRSEEVIKKVKLLRSSYKRLTEVLLIEMYKETNQ